MSNLDLLNARVRMFIDDTPKPFRQSFRGTGDQLTFDLPADRIINDSTLKVYTVATDYQTNDPNSAAPDVTNNTFLTQVSSAPVSGQYILDAVNGTVSLGYFLVPDQLMIVEGTSYALFTDAELDQFITDAVAQHVGSRTTNVRFRDPTGFIQYERLPITIDSLPAPELPLVAMLATIEILWTLSTGASTDIDIITSEGTHIPRGQRFQQLQTQIAMLQAKYEQQSRILGVGLYAISISDIRRVSRQTGRLVPLYVEREYDETTLPIRRLVTPNQDGADYDGPPNANWSQGIF